MYRLTKYEKVRILGTRATQLSMGAPPNICVDNLTDAMEIATRELYDKCLPLVVVRNFPNGRILEIPVSEMEIE
jgi:DNA-directed RNA polymerases I, II, and III subunit RPABC2